MPGQLRRRGGGKIKANPGGPLNLLQVSRAIEQRQTGRDHEERLGLLWEIGGGRQSAARFVAVARTGNGVRMLLRAAILFAEQTRCINQTARSGWHPNERQHHGDKYLEPLHGKSNTTADVLKQCGRLGARDSAGLCARPRTEREMELIQSTGVAWGPL